MGDVSGILVIQTGGTIDKKYPKTKLGYAFEIMEAAVERIVTRVKVPYNVEIVTACRKDSQDITEGDRSSILNICTNSVQDKILITHGTDTMIETGEFLTIHKLPKIIAITGAFLPETFKDSDADFNVGCAIGALQSLKAHGVYICMNGEVLPCDKITRDANTSVFINK